jgi:hypothetical protein
MARPPTNARRCSRRWASKAGWPGPAAPATAARPETATASPVGPRRRCGQAGSPSWSPSPTRMARSQRRRDRLRAGVDFLSRRGWTKVHYRSPCYSGRLFVGARRYHVHGRATDVDRRRRCLRPSRAPAPGRVGGYMVERIAIPVIVITTHDDDATGERAGRSGAVASAQAIRRAGSARCDPAGPRSGRVTADGQAPGRVRDTRMSGRERGRHPGGGSAGGREIARGCTRRACARHPNRPVNPNNNPGG